MEHLPDELQDLRRAVEHEIENYKYEVPAGCVGSPLSPEQVSSYLETMRRALVDPYWVAVFEQLDSNNGKEWQCAVVADDRNGTLVVWDPISGEFMLASIFSGRLCAFNVRGDAVGCFMAI